MNAMVFTTELNEDTEKSLNLEEEQVLLKEIVNSTCTLCLMRGIGLTPIIRIYPVKPCVPCGELTTAFMETAVPF